MNLLAEAISWQEVAQTGIYVIFAIATYWLIFRKWD